MVGATPQVLPFRPVYAVQVVARHRVRLLAVRAPVRLNKYNVYWFEFLITAVPVPVVARLLPRTIYTDVLFRVVGSAAMENKTGHAVIVTDIA